MIQVIDHSNYRAHSGALQSFAALRYEVFVNRYGWQVFGGQEGLEEDQFDSAEAIYLLIQNTDGDVVGGARLLDTARGSLLGTIFPHLVDDGVPEDPQVFEVTRFVVDPRRDRLKGCGNVCAELLWGLQAYGAWAALTHFVSVSYLSLEPILKRAGYRSRRLGKTVEMDGRPVAALEHEVNHQVLRQSRQRVNLAQAVGLELGAIGEFAAQG